MENEIRDTPRDLGRAWGNYNGARQLCPSLFRATDSRRIPRSACGKSDAHRALNVIVLSCGAEGNTQQHDRNTEKENRFVKCLHELPKVTRSTCTVTTPKDSSVPTNGCPAKVDMNQGCSEHLESRCKIAPQHMSRNVS